MLADFSRSNIREMWYLRAPQAIQWAQGIGAGDSVGANLPPPRASSPSSECTNLLNTSTFKHFARTFLLRCPTEPDTIYSVGQRGGDMIYSVGQRSGEALPSIGQRSGNYTSAVLPTRVGQPALRAAEEVPEGSGASPTPRSRVVSSVVGWTLEPLLTSAPRERGAGSIPEGDTLDQRIPWRWRLVRLRDFRSKVDDTPSGSSDPKSHNAGPLERAAAPPGPDAATSAAEPGRDSSGLAQIRA